jgi:hypothetical protein
VRRPFDSQTDGKMCGKYPIAKPLVNKGVSAFYLYIVTKELFCNPVEGINRVDQEGGEGNPRLFRATNILVNQNKQNNQEISSRMEKNTFQ